MDDVLVEVEVFTRFFQPSTCSGSGDLNINVCMLIVPIRIVHSNFQSFTCFGSDDFNVNVYVDIVGQRWLYRGKSPSRFLGVKTCL